MEKKSTVDHLGYNNPYERFMIMILDRLGKLEDRMDNIDNKMSIVMGNLACNNLRSIHVIFKIIVDKQIEPNKIDYIYTFLYNELACTQCFFSLDAQTSIQIVCTDNSVFQKFNTMIDKFKTELKFNICHISIEPEISFASRNVIYMLYKPIDSIVKKIKLINELA